MKNGCIDYSQSVAKMSEHNMSAKNAEQLFSNTEIITLSPKMSRRKPDVETEMQKIGVYITSNSIV